MQAAYYIKKKFMAQTVEKKEKDVINNISKK